MQIGNLCHHNTVVTVCYDRVIHWLYCMVNVACQTWCLRVKRSLQPISPFIIYLLLPVSSECERYQVPRQERPPHADPCEETLQVSLRQELQDLAGPKTPHHQLPPTCLHWDPAQDSRLEPVVTPINCPKRSPILTFLTRPFYTHPTH